MNTRFKILWFEDEIAWFRMEQKHIEEFLEKYCLLPEINRKDGDDFDINELTGNDYDLILLDYKLASGQTGDKIVAEIRNNNILTDVLFYSSEEEEMLKALLLAKPYIDGVYLTKRDYTIFTEKAGNLIDKIIRRSEDLVNLRGFVMDEVSDFEVRIKDVLNDVWDRLTEEERASLEDSTRKTIKRNECRSKKTQQKVMSENPIFIAAVNNRYFFSNSDRLYLLEKVVEILLEKYQLPSKPVYDSLKANYEKHISNYRNALGHKKSTDDVIEITKGNCVAVNNELHQEMRKNLIVYNKIITDIESFVGEMRKQ